jgi:hypothetical protein
MVGSENARGREGAVGIVSVTLLLHLNCRETNTFHLHLNYRVMSTIEDKSVGTLLGVACGDVLGSQVEGTEAQIISGTHTSSG